jgi:YVTN family beta-propeller protein
MALSQSAASMPRRCHRPAITMSLRRSLVALATTLAVLPATAALDGTALRWTQIHAGAGSTPFLSEIVSFEAASRTLWVSGPSGVDVLDVASGARLGFIDTSTFGGLNSIAIHGNLAALAFDNATDRRLPGLVVLYDTGTRAPLAGASPITVGSLPDMLTFTPDGRKLLVANEGTPNAVSDTAYGLPDPVGSVSIIDVGSRTVVAQPVFGGLVPQASNMGTNVRQPGMDWEPEYIAVSPDGRRAFVTLQENNAVAVIDLSTNSATQLIGLGTKDFSQPGNEIDPRDGSGISFVNVPVRGLYMPDAIATYTVAGRVYTVMANEGDFREDNADRVAFGGSGVESRLRVVSDGRFAAGARSFSIRDDAGNLVYDSGALLDQAAAAAGLYDDGRSRDKGVEPEGVALLAIDGRTYAFIGLERTLSGATAVFDITDPAAASFVRLLATDGTGGFDRLLRPEGLVAFTMDGVAYLAVANEGADGTQAGTALWQLTPVPEPGTWAMLLAGMAALGGVVQRRR